MPLPPPSVARKRMHVRSVELAGFKREDGNWDIEARLVDSKDQDYHLSSGVRRAGDPLHEMWVRVTIDRKMNIVDAVACSDATPYPGVCERIAPSYRQLVGLNLFHGFRKAIKDCFDKIQGCSHLSELLMHLPTAAIQSFASEIPDNDDSKHKPYQLDRCHALASSSEVVERYYPRWYRPDGDPEPGVARLTSEV
ncbi:DUF2889 domain-containing protein [Rhodocyclus purpureus]|uniref:DUF2889 domain-containing protein n=1 Tax=Rhodocyclus purpureus TaxID=1067 RepID=UPI001911DB01|nr:DUF2889 domain-containing protein [Rhodocyclus purpureus]MBK5912883.1 hypothetical protein [Rhodocyclus purpureus]